MSDEPRAAPPGTPEHDMLAQIRAYYTARLQQGSCCGSDGAGADTAHPISAEESTTGLGAAGVSSPRSFGCGNPAAAASLRPGESVLDLGSGAGLDAVRAGEAVGPRGSVIGVDMTPAMVAHARAAAERLGIAQVGFLEGRIEALPLEEASADVVISNCVVNLSLEKERVFREIERVLRPGGRIVISDVLVQGAHRHRLSDQGWCGCVDGAVDRATYLRQVQGAGLVEVEIDPRVPEVAEGATYGATVRAVKPDVRPADDEQARAAEALLQRDGLPIDGWRDATTTRWVLVQEGAVRGAVGLELHRGEALLRSLVVDGALRGRGYGRALLRVAERAAVRAGGDRLHALSTTIQDWLRRSGYVETQRTDLPSALNASHELRGACPDHAPAFVKQLGGEERAAGAGR